VKNREQPTIDHQLRWLFRAKKVVRVSYLFIVDTGKSARHQGYLPIFGPKLLLMNIWSRRSKSLSCQREI